MPNDTMFLARAAREAEDAMNTAPDPAALQRFMSEWSRLMRKLATRPARTMAEAHAKAEAIRATVQGNDWQSRFVTGLIDDVKRIAGVRAGGA